MNKNIKRGDIVTIRKGTTVTSLSRGKYVLKRAQTVKVYSVFNGYTHNGVTRKPEVSWTGAGGYWCYANQEDVE